MTFAAPRQRCWARSAASVLDAFEHSGARLTRFNFFTRDERTLASSAERAVDALWAWRGGSPTPRRKSRALAHCSSLKGPDGTSHHAAQILHGGSSEHLFTLLSTCLGDPEAARLFVCAHEWAHAWNTEQGHPLARSAAIHSRTRLAIDAFDALRGVDKSWLARKDLDGPAWIAIRTTDEAFCDALGCFALSKLGFPDASPKMAAFRKATAELGISRSTYHNFDLLLALAPAGHDFEAQLSDFVSSAIERAAPSAARVFKSR